MPATLTAAPTKVTRRRRSAEITLATYLGFVVAVLLIGELATLLGPWSAPAWQRLTAATTGLAHFSLHLVSAGHDHVLRHYWLYSLSTGTLAVYGLAARPVPRTQEGAKEHAFETRLWADLSSSLVVGYLIFSYPFALGVALPQDGARALVTLLAIAPPAFIALIQLYRVLGEQAAIYIGIAGFLCLITPNTPLFDSSSGALSPLKSSGWHMAVFCLSAFGALVASLNFYWEACREADARSAALPGNNPAARAVAPEAPVTDPTQEPAP